MEVDQASERGERCSQSQELIRSQQFVTYRTGQAVAIWVFFFCFVLFKSMIWFERLSLAFFWITDKVVEMKVAAVCSG